MSFNAMRYEPSLATSKSAVTTLSPWAPSPWRRWPIASCDPSASFSCARVTGLSVVTVTVTFVPAGA